MIGSNSFHTPVLLKEVIDFLQVASGRKYIDATIGGGGHAVAILKLGGKVLGIDYDQEAIEHLKRKFQIGKDVTLVRGNFKDLKSIALSNGFEKVKGILFDLGLSSYQLESEDRGFSFQRDEQLDMRMDKSLKVTVADLINGLTKEELYELFSKLAQEKYSWAISNSIIRARKIRPITKTQELANLIASVYRRRDMKTRIHPATKVFQALRIAVNDELNNLREALPQAVELLDNGGRLIVISFHSLEDRIVKQFARQCSLNNKVKILTQKPIVPSFEELRINPRARSAKMRVLEAISR